MQPITNIFSLTSPVNLLGSFTILCISLNIQIAAANPYADDFLLKTNQRFNQINSHLQVNSMNKWDSWVDDSEARFSNNNLSTFDNITSKKSQSYSFRVKLKNKQQQKAEQDLLSLDSQKAGANNQVIYSDELHQSYLFLLKSFEIQQTIDSLSSKLKIAQLESATYEKLITTDEFDPSKFQQADLKIDQLTAQIKFKKKVLNQHLALIGIPTQNHSQTSLFLAQDQWLVSINEMIQTVNQSVTKPINNPALQKLELASDITKKQQQLAAAKLATAVQLVEVEYDADHDLFGATVGIRIPLGENNFDTLHRSHDFQLAQMQWESKLLNIQNNLSEKKSLLHQYHDMYQLEDQLQASINTRLKRILKTNKPELIISLKEEQIKHQYRQQKIYLKMIAIYLDALSISGQITEQPFRNWLHKGHPIIGNQHG